MKQLTLLSFLPVTFLLTGISACERKIDPVSISGAPLKAIETPELRLEKLAGARVLEFTLIVFKEGYSRTEWKQVFADTRVLTKTRRETDVLKRELDRSSATEARLSELENAKLQATLNLVSRDTAFMIALTESDACTIGSSLILTCQGTPGENPMDGGMPTFLAPFQLKTPSREMVWNYPWIESDLVSSDLSPGDFQIRLKLQSEEHIGQKLRLSGEAIVRDGSYFEIEKGGERIPYHRFGYTEVTLELAE